MSFQYHMISLQYHGMPFLCLMAGWRNVLKRHFSGLKKWNQRWAGVRVSCKTFEIMKFLNRQVQSHNCNHCDHIMCIHVSSPKQWWLITMSLKTLLQMHVEGGMTRNCCLRKSKQSWSTCTHRLEHCCTIFHLRQQRLSSWAINYAQVGMTWSGLNLYIQLVLKLCTMV